MSIQQFVILKDKEIKKQAHRVDKASRETVDLDGLAIKILGKDLKFLQGKVLQPRPDRTDPKPASGINANPNLASNNTPIPNIDDDFGAQSVHMSEFPIESSA